MKQFEHVTVSSFEEGARILKEGKGKRQAMAGGSDLLGIYKDGILKTHPETVVNLKQIPEFDTLEETDGWRNGRFEVANIVSEVPDDAHFLVCGSLPFVRDVWQKLTAAGVDESHISTETFFEQ